MNINTVNIRIIRELVIEDMTSRLFKKSRGWPCENDWCAHVRAFCQSEILIDAINDCVSLSNINALCNEYVRLFDIKDNHGIQETVSYFTMEDTMNYIIGLFVYELEGCGLDYI